MANPQVITLEALKNKFRDNIFVKTIDLDSLGDSFADIGAIHKEDYKKLLFQIHNEGGNDFDVEFYGIAEDDTPAAFDNEPEPIPPDFATGKYILLPNGLSTISLNNACTLTDVWTWVLIRAKLSSAGQATTGKIFVRGGL